MFSLREQPATNVPDVWVVATCEPFTNAVTTAFVQSTWTAIFWTPVAEPDENENWWDVMVPNRAV